MMNFHPWKGDRFGKHNGMGLPPRVLLVGESHYGRRHQPSDLTKRVVKDYIDDGGYRFFTGMLKAILGSDTSADRDTRAAFFNAVAFYNFVQHLLEGPRKRPTKEMWQHGAEVFPSCLDLLKPSHAITCGFELWKCGLPDERFSEPPQLEQDILPHLPEKYQQDEKHREEGWIGEYAYEDRTCVIIKIEHPSSPGFSAAAWHPVLRWFLQREE